MTTHNEYAFPSPGSMGEVAHEGMSLRDYFAIHAPPPPFAVTVEVDAKFRYQFADAMLKERLK